MYYLDFVKAYGKGFDQRSEEKRECPPEAFSFSYLHLSTVLKDYLYKVLVNLFKVLPLPAPLNFLSFQNSAHQSSPCLL